MDRVFCHVRRTAVASVAMLSVAIGVGAIWVVARPEVIGSTPTWILFGVVGLLVLPLAVAGALVMDRRALAGRVRPAAEDGPERAPVPFLDGPPTGRPAGLEPTGAASRPHETLGSPTPAPPGVGPGGMALAHAGASTHDERATRHRRARSGVTSQD